jgi:hypothetical protein
MRGLLLHRYIRNLGAPPTFYMHCKGIFSKADYPNQSMTRAASVENMSVGCMHTSVRPDESPLWHEVYLKVNFYSTIHGTDDGSAPDESIGQYLIVQSQCSSSQNLSYFDDSRISSSRLFCDIHLTKTFYVADDICLSTKVLPTD